MLIIRKFTNYFIDAKIMSNPKKLAFITEAVDKMPGEEFGVLHRISPEATIMRPNSEKVEAEILKSIEIQVKQFGTMKEIVIDGHGRPNDMNVKKSGGDRSTEINMSRLLDSLSDLQKRLGTKITDRIVFLGCNTLTEESSAEVNYYRNTAKQLGAQIVGTTNTLTGAAFQLARFVQFTPEGQVVRDHLDIGPHNPIYAITSLSYSEKEFSSDWIDCHIGHTQQEGASCQQAKDQAVETGTNRTARNYDAIKTIEVDEETKSSASARARSGNTAEKTANPVLKNDKKSIATRQQIRIP